MKVKRDFNKKEIKELSSHMSQISFGNVFVSLKIDYIFLSLLLLVVFFVLKIYISKDNNNPYIVVFYFVSGIFLVICVAKVIVYYIFDLVFSYIASKWDNIDLKNNCFIIKNKCYNINKIDRLIITDKFIIIYIQKKYLCLRRSDEIEKLLLHHNN